MTHTTCPTCALMLRRLDEKDALAKMDRIEADNARLREALEEIYSGRQRTNGERDPQAWAYEALKETDHG